MIYTHTTFIFQWKTMEEDSSMLAFVLIFRVREHRIEDSFFFGFT